MDIINPTTHNNKSDTHLPKKSILPINSISTVGDSSILIIQDYSAWGLNMYDFILSNFGIYATVINRVTTCASKGVKKSASGRNASGMYRKKSASRAC